MRLQFLGYKIAFAILFLLKIYKNCVIADRTCHSCHGINCLRTSYNVTQNCIDDFDICVNVFEGQTVVYQGCLEQLSAELRNKCNPGLHVNDQQNLPKFTECFQCNGNLCNNLASETFNCTQCDSNSDINCRSNPENLIPERCPISRTPNEYCFTKREHDRIVRGCSQTLEQQTACLSSEDCMICQPSEISYCNDMVVSSDGIVTGSEGSEGGVSGNEGGNGNGNVNNGGGNSESVDSENHSNGSDNGSSANDNSGGANTESGAGSTIVAPGNVSEGSTPDASGNNSSENGTNGSHNDNSSNDNSEDDTSSDGSNGSSITIVNTFILIFSIFLSYLFIF